MSAGNGAKQPVVCIFCASSPGKNPAHLASARDLSTSLSDAGYKLVYGGGTMGIMGEIAKTFVAGSGPDSVDGIIPRALIRTEKDPSLRNDSPSPGPGADVKQAERVMPKDQLKRTNTADTIPQSEFGNTIIVQDMHARKRMMADRVVAGGPGSGFVALAGGYGTIEEVMEMVTWNQLGIHKMPIIVVNVDGYWDGLLQWVRRSISEGFVAPGNADILVEVKDPSQVLAALQDYKVAQGRFNLDWTKE
ncbi:hypothetical protein LTR64_005261 [Lithohypha guttulata]|uniref:uncharacterized protein n=1 Tax=Lithohypha guttulata TaxID=1690604 RepID=UPI002DE18E0A|nr:hypothetical protein LTR51_002947 [Lithohypha guttulata]